MTSALDTLSDPLVTPVLALLKDAVNADLRAQMLLAGVEPEDAIVSTAPHPVELEIAGESPLPMLTCYRVRSRSRQFSFSHVDHTSTLQLSYITSATAREQLDERWPLLHRVWTAILTTLARGHHLSHQEGASVLLDAGVIRLDPATAQKREVFVAGGDYTYPGFVAEIDVVHRDGAELDTSTLYPVLSFTHRFHIDEGSEDGEADVTAISLTPAGELVPYEEPA